MAASMHLARIATGMPKGVGFLHGKGVHVGAQPDGTTVVRALALNDAHHARFSQASMYRDAPGLEPFSDEIGGASFFEGQCGMCMNIAADGAQVVGLSHDSVKTGHKGIALKKQIGRASCRDKRV